MKDYNSTELGMLIGTAIGGGLSILGFILTGKNLFFIIAGVGLLTGIGIGSIIDKKGISSRENRSALK